MRPCLVFAHGAGAPSASAWMQRWRRRLETIAEVVTFDYRYMEEKRRRPDAHALLVETHRAAIERARARYPGPLVLAGKSMGSRIGCHVAVEHADVSAVVRALVCFGYPLKGQSGKLRDQVLLELRAPILFVQGTRDPLCPLDLLETTRARMRAPSELYVVDDGDHSLEVRKTVLSHRGTRQEDVDVAIFSAIARFVRSALDANRHP